MRWGLLNGPRPSWRRRRCRPPAAPAAGRPRPSGRVASASRVSTNSSSTSNTSSSCTCSTISARRFWSRSQPSIVDHRALDDVGGGALHRRVDRGALGAGAQALVAGVDVLQVQAAAEHGFDIALLARLLARALHEIAHAGIAREVQRDVVLRLAARDAELARQAERAHAVHQAEVDRLGGAALVAADFFHRLAEHFGGGGAVDVGAAIRTRAAGRRPPTGAP